MRREAKITKQKVAGSQTSSTRTKVSMSPSRLERGGGGGDSAPTKWTDVDQSDAAMVEAQVNHLSEIAGQVR